MPIDTVAESTSIISSKDSRESSIPIVYFDRITLDTFDRTTTARAIRSSRRGFSPSKRPRPSPRHGKSDLAINLKMHLELPNSQVTLSADSKILKYLNVIIMRSEDKRISKAVETSGDLLIKKFQNQPGYTKVYQGLLSNLNLKNIIIGATESADKKTLDISFQLDDYPPNAKEHLSYYAMCYIEMKQELKSSGSKKLLAGRGFSPSKRNRPSTRKLGPLSGENVITAGQLNTTSYVYVVTSPFPAKLSGTYWTGPVRQDKNGKWLSGMWTTSKGRPKLRSTKPPLDLDKIAVRNSKIQDFRITKQVPSLNINLKPDKFFPLVIEGKDTYNNFINNPDAYVSNAFLSRDRHNNCKFMFEFDYGKFISSESKFGKILTNPFVPKSTKEKIHLYSRITSLQITRRQVETIRGYNRLSSPTLGIHGSDNSPETKTILETASNKKNGNRIQSIKSFAPEKSIGTLNDQVGSIMELPSSTLKFSPKETRTFMVTDNSAAQLTAGAYQYGVKIEMEDGSVRFLNERLKRLRTLKTYLKGYYELKQIPEKNFQSISNITEYYNRLFAKDPRRDARSVLESAEINNLLTENGRPVGNLTPQDTLFPWIVAPEYFIDTLESISDFSPIIKPSHGSANLSQIRQTAEAKLAESNGKVSKQSLADRRASLNTGSSQSGDPFNEKAARFALRSLLDPFTATPESIVEVIGLFDFLFQKIREMMGSSANLDEPPNPIRRMGVSKNTKVSVLNLKDTFVELFDVRLSHMPSVDYIGFKGSAGNYPPVSGEEKYLVAVQPTAVVGALAAEAMDSDSRGPLDAGLDALTTEDFQLRMDDEEGMSISGPEDDEEDTVEDNSNTSTANETRREKKKRRLKERLQKRRNESGSEAVGIVSRAGVLLTPAIIDSKNGLVIERSTIHGDIAAPARFIDMQNRVVAASTGDEPAGPKTSYQDYVNHLASKLNISVAERSTPMNVEIELNKGQGKNTAYVEANEALGQKSEGNFETNMVTQGSSIAGEDTKLLELHQDQKFARPITQEFINRITSSGALDQLRAKVVGNPKRTGKIYPDRPQLSREKFIAIAKKIKNDPDSVPDLVKNYMKSLKDIYMGSKQSEDATPMYRFSIGMLAKVTIFQGYESNTDGKFMIKKPIFESPKNWRAVLSDLQNNKTSSEIILCRIEKEFSAELGIGTYDGLSMVDTNTYFLITKNAASLTSKGSATKKSRPGQNLRQRLRDAPPGIQKSIAIWRSEKQKG